MKLSDSMARAKTVLEELGKFMDDRSDAEVVADLVDALNARVKRINDLTALQKNLENINSDNTKLRIEKADLARQLDSANQKITFLETQLRSSEEEVAFLRSQIEAPLEIKAGGVKHLPDFLATHECDTTPDFEQKLA